MNEMKIICTGSRNHRNRELIYRDLATVDPTFVVVGDARGADKIVCDWCDENGVAFKVYYANWNVEGRSAGPLRNQRMLDNHSDAEMVMAWPLKGSIGTYHMLKICKSAGMKTWVNPPLALGSGSRKK